MAVVTNGLLIAITSNFVSFEVYRRGGYRDEYNPVGLFEENSSDIHQGLSGYVNWSQSVFDIKVLVDGFAFPSYTAQELVYVNDDGTEVKSNAGTPLYLPFINFTCLEKNINISNCDRIELTNITVITYNGSIEVQTFTDTNYKRFYQDGNCRNLTVATSENGSPEDKNLGVCFNSDFTCR